VGPYLVGYKGCSSRRRRHQLRFKRSWRPRAGRIPHPLRAGADHLGDGGVLAFAVVPFGAETSSSGCSTEPLRLQVSDVNVAVWSSSRLASMGVYGIVLAGWSSNNKYSMMGGLRASRR